jgi:hypothetical protein
MTDVTMTDLRRLLLLVEALHRTLEGDDVWQALGQTFRHDEWLIAVRDADGTPHPKWAASEIKAALATLGALAGPRPETKEKSP